MIHDQCHQAVIALLDAEAMRLREQADKAHTDRRYRAHEAVLLKQASGLGVAIATLNRWQREQVGT